MNRKDLVPIQRKAFKADEDLVIIYAHSERSSSLHKSNAISIIMGEHAVHHNVCMMIAMYIG